MGNWYNDDSPSYAYTPPVPPRRVRARAAEARATHCVGCGATIEASYRGCPQCGREVARVRRPGDATEESCGRCRTKLRPEFLFCPGCQERLLPVESADTICPCGTALDPGHQHCGGCGQPRAT